MGCSSLNLAPSISAFPDSTVGSACTSSFSRFARRSLALRPAHSRSHLGDRYPGASDISSPPCLPRLLPAGAIAGWALHPLEKRRLVTAHVDCRPSPIPRRTLRSRRKRSFGGKLAIVYPFVFLYFWVAGAANGALIEHGSLHPHPPYRQAPPEAAGGAGHPTLSTQFPKRCRRRAGRSSNDARSWRSARVPSPQG